MRQWQASAGFLQSLVAVHTSSGFFFFFNDTATTEIYTLSLHDALPISIPACERSIAAHLFWRKNHTQSERERSEEHTSELQSHVNLVCRLLLEKKKYGAKLRLRGGGAGELAG